MFLGAFSLLLALTGSFVFLAVASARTRLLTYVVSIAALPIIRRRASAAENERVFRLRGGYTIPAIAMALSVWLAAQSALDAWLLTGGLLAVGMLLFGLARHAARR